MEEFNPASFTVIELMFPVALAAATATLLALTGGFWGEKYWPTFREIFSTYLFAGIPIALIGYSVGFLTGISRTPAVGSVLPAVLATIGGLSAYAFGTDAKYKFIVGYSASLLVISLFYGTQSGSSEREVHREERLKTVFELERRLRIYRTNRDLPEKASDWLFLGETVGK